MKFDHNCVRDVLLSLEAESNVITNSDGDVEFVGTWLNEICEKNPQYPQETIFYTLSKLEEGGYIDMSVQWAGGGVSECCVNFITFAGHEFIEKIRQDSVWGKTLKIAGEVGIFSLKMLAKISESVAGSVMAWCKILCKRNSTKPRMAQRNRAERGLKPLSTNGSDGRGGMRAACGVNAVMAA